MANQGCALLFVVGVLAFFEEVLPEKVTFPEGARAAIAAAPAAAESRLLADASGAFGLAAREGGTAGTSPSGTTRNLFGAEGRRQPDCPLCDPSVYSYCGDYLFHDACCCLRHTQQPLPHECRLADCSFLHAKSCPEHSLITRCCCDRRVF